MAMAMARTITTRKMTTSSIGCVNMREPIQTQPQRRRWYRRTPTRRQASSSVVLTMLHRHTSVQLPMLSLSLSTFLLLSAFFVFSTLSSHHYIDHSSSNQRMVEAFHISSSHLSSTNMIGRNMKMARHDNHQQGQQDLLRALREDEEGDDLTRKMDTSTTATSVPKDFGRRSALKSMCTMIVSGGFLLSLSSSGTENAHAIEYSSIDGDVFVPAPRPTAYRVDSTQPPTLIPLDTARKERKILMELGRGSGTDKEEIVDDSLNLNNILNKAVFGSIDAVGQVVGNKKDESKIGPGYASFVCMGLPAAKSKMTSSSEDIDLALSLSSTMVQSRKKSNNGVANAAFGFAFCPISVQPALDVYSKSGDFATLKRALMDSGVDETTVELYAPLLKYAQQQSLDLLALSPEYDDMKAARKDGLQSVDVSRRQLYVADPNGFIAQTKDPRYRLYTDRSLLKDFDSTATGEEKATGYFAERILVHEAGATVLAKYAVQRPEAFVMMVAPIPDVRFLQGINGRIARICAAINPQQNKVTDNAVTTILLNPTAEETLSQSRYLRLEIGTGPETLDYQTKIADYLWFSSSPKVNMIPRLMNPK